MMQAMTNGDTRVTELFEALAVRLGVHESHLRITIRVNDGHYIAPIRVSQNRIHASHVDDLNCQPPENSVGVDVEEIARRLNCIHGSAELVAEYEPLRGGGIRFKYLDVTWEL